MSGRAGDIGWHLFGRRKMSVLNTNMTGLAEADDANYAIMLNQTQCPKSFSRKITVNGGVAVPFKQVSINHRPILLAYLHAWGIVIL